MDWLLNGTQWLLYDSGLGPWVWGMWLLMALLFGYLLASAVEEPEELAVGVGAVAAVNGVGSLLSGQGFLKGASETLNSLFFGGAMVAGIPAAYTLPWVLRAGLAIDPGFLGGLALLGIGALLLFALHVALWAAVTRRLVRSSLPLAVIASAAVLAGPSLLCFLSR